MLKKTLISKKFRTRNLFFSSGLDCGEPDCPGDPNCFDRGTCDVSFEPPQCMDCVSGWYGPACDDVCLMGTANENNTACDCNTTCWHGPGCDVQCSDHGKCNETMQCYCDPFLGWRGTFCEDPGCPYDPEQTDGVPLDCTGHGDCNADMQCECYAGWIASACHVPDCPGTPDCNDRGYCNTTFDTPICTNCSEDWMGPACDEPCLHGTQTPMDSGICICEPGNISIAHALGPDSQRVFQ